MEFTNHILLASVSTISEVVIIRKARDKYLAPSLISDQKYITLPPKSQDVYKRQILYCFRQMPHLNTFRIIQVGYRAGDFQDTVIGTGGEAETLHGGFEDGEAGSVGNGVLME